jgi:hypothetical protein
MQAIFDGLAMLYRWVRTLGPYLMLELLLPGGTLLALTLFLYRSGKLNMGTAGWNPRQLLLVPISALAKGPRTRAMRRNER